MGDVQDRGTTGGCVVHDRTGGSGPRAMADATSAGRAAECEPASRGRRRRRRRGVDRRARSPRRTRGALQRSHRRCSPSLSLRGWDARGDARAVLAPATLGRSRVRSVPARVGGAQAKEAEPETDGSDASWRKKIHTRFWEIDIWVNSHRRKITANVQGTGPRLVRYQMPSSTKTRGIRLVVPGSPSLLSSAV